MNPNVVLALWGWDYRAREESTRNHKAYTLRDEYRLLKRHRYLATRGAQPHLPFTIITSIYAKRGL